MGVLPARIGGKDVWPCEPAWQQQWAERLNSAVTTLSKTGAKVVLLSAPVPPIAVFKGDHPGQFDARQDCANRVLSEVGRHRDEAGFVDVARFVCPNDDKCRLHLDGAVLRDDGLHYRAKGAEAISRWIVPRVLVAAGVRSHAPG